MNNEIITQLQQIILKLNDVVKSMVYEDDYEDLEKIQGADKNSFEIWNLS